MAQTALPAPRQAPPRRRVLGGLLDADGWTWAGVKAAFWFVVIVTMLGWIPDRAYYFTVQRTVELWPLAPLVQVPLVNFCPPDNESVPCPAPAGATLPWHTAPAEVQLPAGRADGTAAVLGTTYVYAGGTDGEAAVSDVFVSHAVGNGNLDTWSTGPSLPEARADAAGIVIGSTMFVIGGFGPEGQPTDTVFSLTVGNDGTLGEWQTADAFALPEPRAGATAVTVSDGIVVMGGTNGTEVTNSVWKLQIAADGAPGSWTPQTPLYEPNMDGVAVHVGDVIFVIGGTNAEGQVVATVQQGLVGGENATVEDPNSITALWRVSEQTNLPVPRTNLSGFTANGGIYIQGGTDGTSPQPQTAWTTPDADGIIPGWRNLPQTDLGQGIAGSAAVVSGSHAFLIAGQLADGLTGDIARTNLAPQEPFFQLGILGMTVPALQLQGEIGQQLGYLNAATVGAINFIILIVIGYLYNHPAKARALSDRIRRR
jgi:N-acetylneuraminic acid mutarotase